MAAKLSHEQIEKQLLELTAELLPRSYSQGSPVTPKLSSRLNQDLGLDSLARLELLRRVEKTFGVELGSDTAAKATTLGYIFEQLVAALNDPKNLPGSAPSGTSHVSFARAGGIERPETAQTLTEALFWHAEKHPEQTHAVLLDDSGESLLSYGELCRQARHTASALLAQGLTPGAKAALMLPTGFDFLRCFFGVLLAGGVPVPLYPPPSLERLEEHLLRQAGILLNCSAHMFITFEEIMPLSRVLQSAVADLKILLANSMPKDVPGYTLPKLSSQDTAFIQYTSGSTGDPKGVVLSHANLLSNIRAMGLAAEISSQDIFVSWLPLYHDMGLIGAWLGSLYLGLPLILMPPLYFLSKPVRWLQAISRFRGTLSAAPNFAYQLCADRLDDTELSGVDLSSWRLAFNGAETVSAATIRSFGQRFAAYGFKPQAMTPVYGLAENSVGLTFTTPGRGPRIDRVKRLPLHASKLAQPAAPDEGDYLEIVGCGVVIPQHELRIVDNNGRLLAERFIGNLQFRGPSSTSGYLNNTEANRKLFNDGWLNSGDLSYMAEEEVFIAGRSKDLIIRAGRNIYPQEIEQIVNELPGIRRGCVAAFAAADKNSETERLVVAAETREKDPLALAQIKAQINRALAAELDAPPDEILLAAPRTIPKTSSGKIRRADCRRLFEGGMLQAKKPVWRQMLRLRMQSLVNALRRLPAALGLYAYAFWCWVVFIAFGALLLTGLVFFKSVKGRRRLARFTARAMLKACAVNIQTQNSQNLNTSSPCILVANHSSYIDSIVLSAVLPPNFTFVAKRDFLGSGVMQFLLGLLGTRFVERHDVQAGAQDTDALVQAAKQGESLVFFPEGTFKLWPGLLPFKNGAFLIAAQALCPIVPLVLCGTRKLLPAGLWLPRRHCVQITVHDPLYPSGSSWQESLRLKEAAREIILRSSGEASAS